MASECCLRGFQWDGTPIGKESTLANNKAYVVGSNADVAIMVIPDLFGWTFVNERLLSDYYAKEVNATVYMPDFFGGVVMPTEIVRDYSRFGELDLDKFHKDNSKEVRWPELLACVQALRSQYKCIGIIGYCYGGWSNFRLGSKEYSPRLVECISTAHPTWLTKEEIDNIGVPVQILAPEVDPAFTPELKAYANAYFPGVEHAFATRGNPDDGVEKRAMIRGKNAQVAWMKEWLHG
ncbi:dienelactone hydrolase [Microthyrium microscopicum]|uniref:Dienelactone hydrolase n=1 Tax=Microthyrium microscopicum TaxID=703497 RepID=A0A6A6TUR2_9PEZI|nr:dienelactone hydrolase [Microthyrium microscopicum]